MRVLLVEDDPANRATLAAILDADGFDVECAEGVMEAKRCFQGASAYACVIIDRKLGDGHGLDLLPDIRVHSPAARVIVLTGDRDLVPKDAKVDLVIGKGEDLSGLIEVLGNLREARGR